MTKLYAGLAAASVAALLGGSAWYVLMQRPDDAFAQCRQGNVAGGDIGGPFTLVNSKGETVTEADVLTKPSLVYFGYTFCPDVCPFDVARNALAADLLAETGHEVTPVFISVDPGRDTPEVLAAYAQNMHEDMIALSGSEEQVRAASQAYRTYYRIHDSDDEFYLVDHSTFTYLVLPQHGFVEFFRRDATAEEIAERTACFLDA
jgi:protein SCO1